MNRRSPLPALLLCLSLCGGSAAAAEPAGIQLTPQPDVAPHIAAFPRIAEPQGPQAARINQGLAAGDARARQAAADCRAQAQPPGDSKDADWERTVSVAMRGPRYLALVASSSWFCGGAYPSTDSFALAYDQNTGAPLNWQRLLPKALVQRATLDTAGDGTRLGVVVSPQLQALYLQDAALDHDCVDALHDSQLTFMLWPDAAHDGVTLEPSGLPHVIAACSVEVVLPMATLRRLGVAPELLDAIAAAHQAGLYDAAATARAAKPGH